MRVAGVDGCKGGWLVVIADASGPLRIVDTSIAPTFLSLIDRTRQCVAVGVDIPIGLSEGPERRADIAARQLLGFPRRTSVFRAPCQPVLHETSDETDYSEVCTVSRKYCLRRDGKPAAISKQAWRIMPKVREANESMTPDLQDRIVEVHPEVCFWKLNGERPMEYKKSANEGAAERLALLLEAFESGIITVAPRPRKVASLDDLYDACAAAWTAARVAYGTAERLPTDPPHDSRGLRMEIVY
ncbi:MAG: DUF429 domain-containing protein [Chloroflexi bacterium]|nr:DUF429 domain-containing protein [Chloroflexota bacterium]